MTESANPQSDPSIAPELLPEVRGFLGSEVASFEPGRVVFSRFVLESVLGRGGMSVVWKAYDKALNDQVALKFVPEAVRKDTTAFDDLVNEARRSRRLTHPNIVRVHDLERDDQAAAISLEFVDGETMSLRLFKKPERCFEPDEVVDVLVQLCSALDYAHNNVQVVHRDLKPGNLLVTSAGQVKISDFGIASSISHSLVRMHSDTGNSGTLQYMSPQQARGAQPAVTDDVYGLGTTIFEFLTGRPPFFSGDVMRQLMEEEPPSVLERRRQFGVGLGAIPDTWEETLSMCLAKHPADRPESVAEVARMLMLPAANLGGRTITVASLKNRRKRRAISRERTNKLVSGLIGVIVFLVLGFALWYVSLLENIQVSAEDGREILEKTVQESRLSTEQIKTLQELLKEKDRWDEVTQAKKELITDIRDLCSTDREILYTLIALAKHPDTSFAYAIGYSAQDLINENENGEVVGHSLRYPYTDCREAVMELGYALKGHGGKKLPKPSTKVYERLAVVFEEPFSIDPSIDQRIESLNLGKLGHDLRRSHMQVVLFTRMKRSLELLAPDNVYAASLMEAWSQRFQELGFDVKF